MQNFLRMRVFLYNAAYMKLFVFDTETTWFVEREGPLEVQPYIVQFSGILLELQLDKTLLEIDRIDAYVKPPISIPFGASQVHGIYDKDVQDKAVIADQVEIFLSYLNRADMVVGHNIEYDESVINYELQRLGRKGDYNPQKTLCTMKFNGPLIKSTHHVFFVASMDGVIGTTITIYKVKWINLMTRAQPRCFCVSF